MDRQRQEFARLWQIMERVNRGLRLDEVLDFVFEECRDVIPCHRIAYAIIDYERRIVEARWSRSEGIPRFPVGYRHAFAETSLMGVAAAGRPRILNDLAAYAAEHPRSDVTRMLVDEGLRSSLTCPLKVEDRTVGFLFFDHREANVYRSEHIACFQQIAGVIASGVERAQLFSELNTSKEIIERQNRDLAGENERHAAEMAMARQVQRSLIAEALPRVPGLELAMLYEPAELIGGDLLDALPLDENHLLVTLADAMGHGVPAALLMTMVRTALHAAVSPSARRRPPPPSRILQRVNRMIVELFHYNYVTAVCALVDTAGRTVTLSSAGHPPALIVRGASGDVDEITEGQIPMGIEWSTPYSDVTVPLAPGDTMFLYTDGVIEAADPGRRRFGMAGLKQFLSRARTEDPEQLLEKLREDLRGHCECASLEDDMAALAVRRV